MDYLDIVKHYESCYEKYGDNCKGVDWPKEEDADKRYRVMMDVIRYDNYVWNGIKKPVVLDFGCGLAHLYNYIVKNNIDVMYTGVDASQKFIDKCNEKYPNIEFIKADFLAEEISCKYDYIVANGVFTEKRELSFDEMFDYFKKIICVLYDKCNRGIAFNVMSKDVDWERDDLFHVGLSDMSKFLTKEISRNYIIRNDYGLYEYTVYLYK